MAIQILNDSDGDAIEAVEGSTLGITISFTDDDGAAETPTSANWTLTDVDGNPINSRDEVNIGSLDTSVTVTLSGDDLAITAGETGTLYGEVKRRFIVQAVYDSTLGNNLPMVDSVEFKIRDIKYAV